MGLLLRVRMTKDEIKQMIMTEQEEIRELKEKIRLLKRLEKLRDLEKRLKAHPGLTLHTNEEK